MRDDEPAGTLDPERYDRWFERAWGRHAFSIERDALLAALGLLDGRELVELGCGTGRFTQAFERAGAEVTGIDHDPGMLALAATRTDATLLLADPTLGEHLDRRASTGDQSRTPQHDVTVWTMVGATVLLAPPQRPTGARQR